MKKSVLTTRREAGSNRTFMELKYNNSVNGGICIIGF